MNRYFTRIYRRRLNEVYIVVNAFDRARYVYKNGKENYSFRLDYVLALVRGGILKEITAAEANILMLEVLSPI